MPSVQVEKLFESLFFFHIFIGDSSAFFFFFSDNRRHYYPTSWLFLPRPLFTHVLVMFAHNMRLINDIHSTLCSATNITFTIICAIASRL